MNELQELLDREPYEHKAAQDYDRRELAVGSETDISAPEHTVFVLRRGESLANKDSDLRKLADMNIDRPGLIICLKDLRAKDVEAIGTFFVEYAHRMRKFD